jgi:hypothetical protein
LKIPACAPLVVRVDSVITKCPINGGNPQTTAVSPRFGPNLLADRPFFTKIAAEAIGSMIYVH